MEGEMVEPGDIKKETTLSHQRQELESMVLIGRSLGSLEKPQIFLILHL